MEHEVRAPDSVKRGRLLADFPGGDDDEDAYTPGAGEQADDWDQFARRGNTTVMMRNLPTSYSRDRLIDLLNGQGFAGQFDLMYLPIDFTSDCNLGYAFVNLTTHQHALRFVEVFHGFSSWPMSGCRKLCVVCWGEVQGLRANIKRYHKSAIMRKDVPEDYKPALFKGGRQVPFPIDLGQSRRSVRRVFSS